MSKKVNIPEPIVMKNTRGTVIADGDEMTFEEFLLDRVASPVFVGGRKNRKAARFIKEAVDQIKYQFKEARAKAKERMLDAEAKDLEAGTYIILEDETHTQLLEACDDPGFQYGGSGAQGQLLVNMIHCLDPFFTALDEAQPTICEKQDE